MSKRTPNPAKSDAAQEYRKPRADVYTVLLVIAIAMLVVGTMMLWWTMKEYNYEIKGGPQPVWHRPAAGTTLDVADGVA